MRPNLRFDTDRQQRRCAPLSPAGQAGRWPSCWSSSSCRSLPASQHGPCASRPAFVHLRGTRSLSHRDHPSCVESVGMHRAHCGPQVQSISAPVALTPVASRADVERLPTGPGSRTANLPTRPVGLRPSHYPNSLPNPVTLVACPQRAGGASRLGQSIQPWSIELCSPPGRPQG